MLNVLLVLIGSLGVFMIITSLFSVFQFKKGLGSRGSLAIREISLAGKLETLLRQAHAPIKVREFLMVSGGIGLALGGAAFLVTRGLLISLVMLLGRGVLYYLFLLEKREKLLLLYEEGMPQVIVILREYLRVHGSDLVGAIQEVASEGPEVVQSDFQQLAAAFKISSNIDVQTINEVMTFRNSPSLSKVVELLLLYRGINVGSLPEALESLQVTIDEEVDIAAENASEVYGPRRNLLMICLIVLGVTVMMVVGSPIFRAFYGTLPGQVTLLVAIGLTVGMYFLGTRAASRASMTRPYVLRYPEKRSASSLTPIGTDLSGKEEVGDEVP